MHPETLYVRLGKKKDSCEDISVEYSWGCTCPILFFTRIYRWNSQQNWLWSVYTNSRHLDIVILSNDFLVSTYTFTWIFNWIVFLIIKDSISLVLSIFMFYKLKLTNRSGTKFDLKTFSSEFWVSHHPTV